MASTISGIFRQGMHCNETKSIFLGQGTVSLVSSDRTRHIQDTFPVLGSRSFAGYSKAFKHARMSTRIAILAMVLTLVSASLAAVSRLVGSTTCA